MLVTYVEDSREPCSLSCTGPLLLGGTEATEEEKVKLKDMKPWRSLAAHRDEDQVRLDVDRSFIYYPDSKSLFSNRKRLGY